MFAGTDRYRVTRELGAGAFGAVFEAEDRELQRTVALKTMLQTSPKALVAFKREFRRFAELHHPNVVRLYELEQAGDVTFFSMECVPAAKTWLAYVEDQDAPLAFAPTFKRLDEAEAVAATHAPADVRIDEARLLRSLAQFIAGLDAIHSIGFVHRDLKPANVLADQQGRVKILDFGIAGAGADSDHTRTVGGFRGTPLYMAPEQTDKGVVTSAADWYAVGAMLFEAITGVPPFSGSILQIIGAKVTADFPDVALREGVSPALLDVARGLMAPVVAQRAPAIATLRTLVAPYVASDAARTQTQTLTASAATTTGGGASTGPAYAESSARCVGREDELVLLKRELAATTDGQPRVTVLLAESGVGKSTLLREFGRRARDEGAWVFSGRSGPRESMAFKVLDPVIDAIAEHLAQLADGDAAALLPRDIGALADIFPALMRVPRIAALKPRVYGASAQERLAVAALVLGELLGAMGDRARVSLHFDDVQWGDSDSVSVLRAILRAPRPPGCHFVFAARREELGRAAVLTELLETIEPSESQRIELSGMSLETSIQIARDQLEGSTRPDGDIDAQALALARAAEGNGFFLDLLIRAERDAMRVSAANEPQPHLEQDLRSLLQARVAALGPAPSEVLRAIALAGRPCAVPLLCQATRRTRSEVSEALDELDARGLVLRVAGKTSAFEPFHDRVLEACLGAMSAGIRSSAHVALAEAERALAGERDDRELDAEFVFTQLVAAERLADALPFATAALQQVRMADALHHVAALCEDAVRCASAAGEDPAPFYARLGATYVQTFQVERALATFVAGEQACRSAAGVQDLRRRRGLVLISLGRMAEGEDLVRPILAAWGVRLPTSTWGYLFAILFGQLAYFFGQRAARRKARLRGSDPACLLLHQLSGAYVTHDFIRATAASAIALRATLRRGRRDDMALAKGVWRTSTTGFWHRPLRVSEAEEDVYDDPAAGLIAQLNFTLHYLINGQLRLHEAGLDRLRETMHRADPLHLAGYEAVFLGKLYFTGRLRQPAHRAQTLLQLSKLAADSLPMLTPVARLSELTGEVPYAAGSPQRPPLGVGIVNEFEVAQLLACYRGQARALLQARWPNALKAVRLPGLRRLLRHMEDALRLSAYRPGERAPSASRIRRIAAKAPGAHALIARARLAGHAFIRDQHAESQRILEDLIPAFDADDVAHFAASARMHLARLVRASEAARADELEADARVYFEREEIRDPERFSLAIVPGFRALYPERADLDTPLEGPPILAWGEPA